MSGPAPSPAELLDGGALTGADPDSIYDAFTAWAAGTGLQLYPAQAEALIELLSGSNVILSTPTGSGKSLVATGALFAALTLADPAAAAPAGRPPAVRRCFYTAPIKALVSEKFFALCEVFGSARVGMMTGDASVNGEAEIICCTAEVLANLALRAGSAADIGLVVMDEFHYYGDSDRGWAWQVPLLELTGAQFLLMSATLGSVDFFRSDLSRRTGRPTAVVSSAERPVPLFHYYATTPLHETVTELLNTRQSPVYIVHFTQAAALEQAQALTSINVSSRAEKDLIAAAIGDFRFSSGFGKTLSRLVRHGIGVHHAGMLPKYRRLVEQLAQAGLLKVICGTDTLGVGINVPIRTVVLASLSKYDGRRTRQLQAREFHQIAGRAGRAGYDTAGTVVVQAPDHEVENARLLAKAGDDEKKRRRVQRKKAPVGFVSWSKATHDRLIVAEPEPLSSHFRVSHSMLLNVIARPGDAFAAMRSLLTDNHESGPARRRHVRSAIQAYRSLLTAGVIQRLDEPDDTGRTVRLTVDLPPNFALNHPLSTFALAAIELLDTESETFALDVLSVIEATLEDPRQVLYAQESKARGEAVAQLKAEGVEYEERMVLLEEVTYPRPLAELLEAAFQTYRTGHPWLIDHQLSPKSVVRDLWERAMSFSEYVAYLRADPLRGPAAALPQRCLPGVAGRRAAGRQDRGGGRPDGLARRAGAPGRLQPARRVGAVDQPRARRRPAEAGGGPHPAVDRQHPRVHGAGAQCDVPPGGTGRAPALRRTRRARCCRRLGCRGLAGRAGRLLRRVRPDRDRRRRPRAEHVHPHRGTGALAGPADPAGPGRRP